MILLVGEGVWPGWMVALIVARELLEALAVALALTWISGLDYARLAPRLLRGDPTAGSARGTKSSESTFSSSPASRQTLP
jgi:hypothetical protein